ncbi:Retrovirus-related Pol polyprotein, partial [Mucuna pruriens]
VVPLCSVCLHSAETKPDSLCRDHLCSVSAEYDSASAEKSQHSTSQILHSRKTTVKTHIIIDPFDFGNHVNNADNLMNIFDFSALLDQLSKAEITSAHQALNLHQVGQLLLRAEYNSDNPNQKQTETKTDSAHQVATPNQAGQSQARSITDLLPPQSPPHHELKPLLDRLKYVYLDNNQHSLEEKLLKVFWQHKKAIEWKLSNLLRINPSICTKRILIEEEACPIRKQQRRLNLTILDVVKKEVTKLLAAGIFYTISDSNWVSPVQVMPKKSRMTVARNQLAEMLNLATCKGHFPLSFIDQVLEKLAEKSHYYFLDGYSGYMQIHIAPEDQHKTTFTCPFDTFAYTRMPFGLCNAPSTFQRCMLSIFLDLVEECMDHFMVYADTFHACLENLSRVLERCIETNLVLNFEKCHFMVIEGIVLGHLVSSRGIDVDKAKVDVITSLLNPALVWDVHSFLGHASFYRRFIRNFSKIALPLSKLQQKDVDFVFDEACVEAFEELKTRLTSAPILQAPNWELPFELMCDASNLALGAVLGQRVEVDKPTHVIACASRTMDPTQINYTTMEKELLAIEFNLETTNKKGAENTGRVDSMPIRDNFSNEELLQIAQSQPWFADICNFLVASTFPLGASRGYKAKLESEAKYYVWDDPYLWRFCNDQITCKCIPDAEFLSVLHFCHSALGGDHYGSTWIAQKVLNYGLYWPTIYQDAHKFVSAYSSVNELVWK